MLPDDLAELVATAEQRGRVAILREFSAMLGAMLDREDALLRAEKNAPPPDACPHCRERLRRD